MTWDANLSSVHAVYGTLNAEGTPPGYLAAIDPRHPSLGMRVISVGDKNLDTGNDDGNIDTNELTRDK